MTPKLPPHIWKCSKGGATAKPKKPPLVPGESAFQRTLRLNQIWQSAHKSEREAYLARRLAELAALRKQFAVPPVR
jgi:hypothetical protein